MMDDTKDPAAPFAELVRLQMDFQARLAEETLRYLRKLQASGLPMTPSTVVRGDQGRPPIHGVLGGTNEFTEEIENRQRVHAIFTAMLTPLVADDGTTWFAREDPTTLIVPPGETMTLSMRFDVPAELPPGTYRGAVVLAGLEGGALPAAVEIAAPPRGRRRRNAS